MKTFLSGLVLSMASLIVLSACGPATPTGQPTAAASCKQFGCPYPAVCDQNSGACVINQPQGPSAVAPQGPAAGAGQNNVGANPIQPVYVPPTPSETPSPIAPAAKLSGGALGVAANPGNPGPIGPASCVPPAPSLSQISLFCNDKPSGLGGASFTITASDVAGGWPNDVACKDTPGSGQFAFTCSGAQKSSFQVLACSSCGGPLKFGSAALGDYTCSNGYVRQSDGTCYPATTTTNYVACPAGSHYEAAQQWCLDDATQQKLTDLCPAGTVAYYPEYHFCMTQSYPAAFDCRLFTIQLGECLSARTPKTTGPCPAGQSLQLDALNGGYVCK